MVDIIFKWDNKKDKSNLKKHGVSFEKAQSVFDYENAVEFYDINHSEKEDRFLLLGLSSHLRILLVCYYFKEKEFIIKIISARKATKNEQHEYFGGKL